MFKLWAQNDFMGLEIVINIYFKILKSQIKINV